MCITGYFPHFSFNWGNRRYSGNSSTGLRIPEINMTVTKNKHDGDWMLANRLSFDKHSGDMARFMHTSVLRRYRLHIHRPQNSAQCSARTDPPSPRVFGNAIRVHTKSWMSNSRTLKNFFGGKHNFSRTFSVRHPHILFTILSTEPLRLVKQVAHISWCCKKCEQWLLIRKIGTQFGRSMI